MSTPERAGSLEFARHLRHQLEFLGCLFEERCPRASRTCLRAEPAHDQPGRLDHRQRISKSLSLIRGGRPRVAVQKCSRRDLNLTLPPIVEKRGFVRAVERLALAVLALWSSLTPVLPAVAARSRFCNFGF
eukprot:2971769-Pleurochrysis_carterae.AAC.2